MREPDRLKEYFYSAIDIKGKVAFSAPYARLSSRNTQDIFQKLQRVSPLSIRAMQMGNGFEFQGGFDEYLELQNIPTCGVTHVVRASIAASNAISEL